MNNIITYLSLSTVSLFLGYLIYLLLFKKDTYFTWNRFLLISTIGFSVFAPILFIAFAYSPLFTALPSIELPTAVINSVQILEEESLQQSSLLSIFGIVYLIGFLFVSYRFIKQLYFIRKLKQSSTLSQWQDHKIYSHSQNIEAFSFFGAMYINMHELEKENKESILIHESIHIEEKHSLDIIFIQFLQLIFWFNPLFLLYKKEIQSLHEFICDKKAIKQLNESEYRIALINYQLVDTGFTITHSFNQLNLKRRFSMMKKQKSGSLALKALLLIPILGFSIVLMSSIFPQNTAITSFEEERIEETTATTQEMDDIVQPKYPGGMEAMSAFLSNNITYPELAKSEGIHGTVYIQMIIRKNGKVSKVKMARGLRIEHEGARLIEKEAIRVIKKMPKWSPGTKNGKRTKIEFTIPIKFKLD